MRQPTVKDLRSKTKAKDLTAKAKDFIRCPRGASKPRSWPRGLHHWQLQTLNIYFVMPDILRKAIALLTNHLLHHIYQFNLLDIGYGIQIEILKNNIY